MFIRRTKTRTTHSGEHYYSYRLVDTFRVAERVRQRTLLNLGSGFSIPSEQWKPLTQRIEQIVLGQHELLLPFPPEVEREAQHIAASLLNKYSGSDRLLSPQKGETGARAEPPASESNPHLDTKENGPSHAQNNGPTGRAVVWKVFSYCWACGPRG